MSDEIELAFPFVHVSDVDMAFGGISNYDEVLMACPAGFFENPANPWSQLASMLSEFCVGAISVADQEVWLELFQTDMAKIAVAQIEYLETWLGSYRPTNEQKMAVCGWLLSLMFTSVPPFTPPQAA